MVLVQGASVREMEMEELEEDLPSWSSTPAAANAALTQCVAQGIALCTTLQQAISASGSLVIISSLNVVSTSVSGTATINSAVLGSSNTFAFTVSTSGLQLSSNPGVTIPMSTLMTNAVGATSSGVPASDTMSANLGFASLALSVNTITVQMNPTTIAFGGSFLYGPSTVSASFNLLGSSSAFALALSGDQTFFNAIVNTTGLNWDGFAVSSVTAVFANGALNAQSTPVVASFPGGAVSAGLTITAAGKFNANSKSPMAQTLASTFSGPLSLALTASGSGSSLSVEVIASVATLSFGSITLTGTSLTMENAGSVFSFALASTVSFSLGGQTINLTASANLAAGASTVVLNLAAPQSITNVLGFSTVTLSNLAGSLSLTTASPFVSGFSVAGNLAIGSDSASVAIDVGVSANATGFNMTVNSFQGQLTGFTLASLLETLIPNAPSSAPWLASPVPAFFTQSMPAFKVGVMGSAISFAPLTAAVSSLGTAATLAVNNVTAAVSSTAQAAAGAFSTSLSTIMGSASLTGAPQLDATAKSFNFGSVALSVTSFGVQSNPLGLQFAGTLTYQNKAASINLLAQSTTSGWQYATDISLDPSLVAWVIQQCTGGANFDVFAPAGNVHVAFASSSLAGVSANLLSGFTAASGSPALLTQGLFVTVNAGFNTASANPAVKALASVFPNPMNMQLSITPGGAFSASVFIPTATFGSSFSLANTTLSVAVTTTPAFTYSIAGTTTVTVTLGSTSLTLNGAISASSAAASATVSVSMPGTLSNVFGMSALSLSALSGSFTLAPVAPYLTNFQIAGSATVGSGSNALTASIALTAAATVSNTTGGIGITVSAFTFTTNSVTLASLLKDFIPNAPATAPWNVASPAAFWSTSIPAATVSLAPTGISIIPALTSAGAAAQSAIASATTTAAATATSAVASAAAAAPAVLSTSVSSLMSAFTGSDSFSGSDSVVGSLNLGSTALSITAFGVQTSANPGLTLSGSVSIAQASASFSVIALSTSAGYGFGVDFSLNQGMFTWLWNKFTGGFTGADVFNVTSLDISFANAALAASNSSLLAAYPPYAANGGSVPTGLFVSVVGSFNAGAGSLMGQVLGNLFPGQINMTLTVAPAVLSANLVLPVANLGPNVQLTNTQVALSVSRGASPVVVSVALTTTVALKLGSNTLTLAGSLNANTGPVSTLLLSVTSTGVLTNVFGWSALSVSGISGSIAFTGTAPYLSAFSIAGTATLGPITASAGLSCSLSNTNGTFGLTVTAAQLQVSSTTVGALLSALFPNAPAGSPWLSASASSIFATQIPALQISLSSTGVSFSPLSALSNFTSSTLATLQNAATAAVASAAASATSQASAAVGQAAASANSAASQAIAQASSAAAGMAPSVFLESGGAVFIQTQTDSDSDEEMAFFLGSGEVAFLQTQSMASLSTPALPASAAGAVALAGYSASTLSSFQTTLSSLLSSFMPSGSSGFSYVDNAVTTMNLNGAIVSITQVAFQSAPLGFAISGSVSLANNNGGTSSASFALVLVKSSSFMFGATFHFQNDFFSTMWAAVTQSSTGSDIFSVSTLDVAFANNQLVLANYPKLNVLPASYNGTLAAGMVVNVAASFNTASTSPIAQFLANTFPGQFTMLMTLQSTGMFASLTLPTAVFGSNVTMTNTVINLTVTTATASYMPASVVFSISTNIQMVVAGKVIAFAATANIQSTNPSIVFTVASTAPIAGLLGWSALTVSTFNGQVVLVPSGIQSLTAAATLNVGPSIAAALNLNIALTNGQLAPSSAFTAQFTGVSASALMSAIYPSAPSPAPWTNAGFFTTQMPPFWVNVSSAGVQVTPVAVGAGLLSTTLTGAMSTISGSTSSNDPTCDSFLGSSGMNLGAATLTITQFNVQKSPLAVALAGSVSYNSMIATFSLAAINNAGKFGFGAVLHFGSGMLNAVLDELVGTTTDIFNVVECDISIANSNLMTANSTILNVFPPALNGSIPTGLVVNVVGSFNAQSASPAAKVLAQIFPSQFSMALQANTTALTATVILPQANLSSTISLVNTQLTLNMARSPFTMNFGVVSTLNIQVGGQSVPLAVNVYVSSTTGTFQLNVQSLGVISNVFGFAALSISNLQGSATLTAVAPYISTVYATGVVTLGFGPSALSATVVISANPSVPNSGYISVSFSATTMGAVMSALRPNPKAAWAQGNGMWATPIGAIVMNITSQGVAFTPSGVNAAGVVASGIAGVAGAAASSPAALAAATGTVYNMASPFTFTTMGATGANGPTSISYGTSTPGAGTSYALQLKGGIQYWTVPHTGNYTFTVAGAGSENPSSISGIVLGYGMVFTATVPLTAGQLLAILVGQQGGYGSYNGPGGNGFVSSGGGGTFIAQVTAVGALSSAVPILVAGGAGGIGYQSFGSINANANAVMATTGNAGLPGAPTSAGAGGAGPAGGANPTVAAYGWSNSGAGFAGNGAMNPMFVGNAPVAQSFINGGTGDLNGVNGGFGGGGAGMAYSVGAGGGGYGGGGSGGSCGQGAGGGGGGSFVASTASLTGTAAAATNAGQGFVTIISPPAPLYTMAPTFTFTNMGANGAQGPTSVSYGASTPGAGTSYALQLNSGIQYWTVPTSGTYTFTLAGAGSQNPTSISGVTVGYGMVYTATLPLTSGQILAILVGQQGGYGSFSGPGGNGFVSSGGGGTFIAQVTAIGALSSAVPLLVAGGAAGVGYQNSVGTNSNVNGVISTTGANGQPFAPTNCGSGGVGPAGGSNPLTTNRGFSNPGAGWSGNGVMNPNIIGTAPVAQAFINGGTGDLNGVNGGFGGGGAGMAYSAGGGGGGYGGGGAGGSSGQGAGGGGGGSFVAGTATLTGTAAAATNPGMGYVTVQLPTASTTPAAPALPAPSGAGAVAGGSNTLAAPSAPPVPGTQIESYLSDYDDNEYVYLGCFNALGLWDQGQPNVATLMNLPFTQGLAPTSVPYAPQAVEDCVEAATSGSLTKQFKNSAGQVASATLVGIGASPNTCYISTQTLTPFASGFAPSSCAPCQAFPYMMCGSSSSTAVYAASSNVTAQTVAQLMLSPSALAGAFPSGSALSVTLPNLLSSLTGSASSGRASADADLNALGISGVTLAINGFNFQASPFGAAISANVTVNAISASINVVAIDNGGALQFGAVTVFPAGFFSTLWSTLTGGTTDHFIVSYLDVAISNANLNVAQYPLMNIFPSNLNGAIPWGLFVDVGFQFNAGSTSVVGKFLGAVFPGQFQMTMTVNPTMIQTAVVLPSIVFTPTINMSNTQLAMTVSRNPMGIAFSLSSTLNFVILNQPFALTGVISCLATDPSITVGLYLRGTINNVFGIKGFSISNLGGSVTVGVQPPWLDGLTAQGTLTLGAGLNAFSATVAISYSAVQPTQNYIYATFTSLTLGSIFQYFMPSYTLPAWAAGTGFPTGATFSFSAGQNTLPNSSPPIVIPLGLYFSGTLNIFGVSAAMNVNLALPQFYMSANVNPITIGSLYSTILPGQPALPSWLATSGFPTGVQFYISNFATAQTTPTGQVVPPGFGFAGTINIFGINETLAMAVSGTNFYLYAALSSVTLNSMWAEFGWGSLPTWLGGVGFPNGVTFSFSTFSSVQTALNGQQIQPGVYFSGTLQLFAGISANINMVLEFSPNLFAVLSASLAPVTFSSIYSSICTGCPALPSWLSGPGPGFPSGASFTMNTMSAAYTLPNGQVVPAGYTFTGQIGLFFNSTPFVTVAFVPSPMSFSASFVFPIMYPGIGQLAIYKDSTLSSGMTFSLTTSPFTMSFSAYLKAPELTASVALIVASPTSFSISLYAELFNDFDATITATLNLSPFSCAFNAVVDLNALFSNAVVRSAMSNAASVIPNWPGLGNIISFLNNPSTSGVGGDGISSISASGNIGAGQAQFQLSISITVDGSSYTISFSYGMGQSLASQFTSIVNVIWNQIRGAFAAPVAAVATAVENTASAVGSSVKSAASSVGNAAKQGVNDIEGLF